MHPTEPESIEQAGEGTQIVPVTWDELHKLNDETGQAAVYAPSPDKKRLIAVMGKVVKFFEEEHAEVFGLNTPKTAKRQPAKTDRLFQFKITLLDIKPAIWRRIQVEDCTLDKLHEHIQTAMGWTNSHLHQFEIASQRYADPVLMEETFEELGCADSTRTKISKILPTSGKRLSFQYEYDFGDSWEHEVVFEGCPPPEPGKKYPLCLEGERACPPEDVGGIGGFYEFLEDLADPKHERHAELLEWIGPFDPQEFDAFKATKAMRKGLSNWRE